MKALILCVGAVVLIFGTAVQAQAPDGNAILRAAGVELPRSGAEGAFDAGVTPPSPVPAGAFSTLLIGMGPVGPRARARNAYAFGVLAGRSARTVPPGELAAAGIAILQMVVDETRSTRIAGTRVAGRVFAAPIDGKPGPRRPSGLVEAVMLMLNIPNPDEQAAAMEAVGLFGEAGAVPTLTEMFRGYRERNNRRMAARALEALTRIGHATTEPLVRQLAADGWGANDEETALVIAYARARFLKDGSRARLEAAAEHRTLGPNARAYLAELGPSTQ